MSGSALVLSGRSSPSVRSPGVPGEWPRRLKLGDAVIAWGSEWLGPMFGDFEAEPLSNGDGDL